VIVSLIAVPAFAGKNSKNTTESTTETKAKLEINSYKARIEEIRDMDKSDMTVSEKRTEK